MLMHVTIIALAAFIIATAAVNIWAQRPMHHTITLDRPEFFLTDELIKAMAHGLIRLGINDGRIGILVSKRREAVYYRAPGSLSLDESPELTRILKQHLPEKSKRRFDTDELQFDVPELLEMLSARERLAMLSDGP